jgi:hypothetical protein
MDQSPKEAADRIQSLGPEAVVTLLANDLCPLCLRSLDTGYECNGCGYDARPLVELYGEERLKKARDKEAE